MRTEADGFFAPVLVVHIQVIQACCAQFLELMMNRRHATELTHETCLTDTDRLAGLATNRYLLQEMVFIEGQRWPTFGGRIGIGELQKLHVKVMGVLLFESSSFVLKVAGDGPQLVQLISAQKRFASIRHVAHGIHFNPPFSSMCALKRN